MHNFSKVKDNSHPPIYIPPPPSQAPPKTDSHLFHTYNKKSYFLQMGRQNSETMVMHSSIALLQERFRQLQRVKQMREERELLRLLSESERLISPTTPTRQFFDPPYGTSSSKKHSCLYFGPESQGKCAQFQAVDTPLLMSLWPRDRSILRASNSLDDAEVDTSLHL